MEQKNRYASQIPRACVEVITPAIAKDMLEHNPNNRKIKPHIVSSIAESIRAGRFTFTNASIGFDTDGNLIDGQHRLSAIVAADTPIAMVVVYGANQSPYLDRGARRTIKDNLTIVNGKPYETAVISAINHMYRLYTGKHLSLDDTKVGLAYDLIRQDIEATEVKKIYAKDRKKITCSAAYLSAIIILLVSEKYDVRDICAMDELFSYGYTETNIAPHSPRLIIDLRNDYLNRRKPFNDARINGTHVDEEIELTNYYLRTMLAYLSKVNKRKSTKDANAFTQTVLAEVFDLVDKEYVITEKAG